MVRMLLEKGADVNVLGLDGTAFDEALSRGYDLVVQILLDKEARRASDIGGSDDDNL